MKEIIQKFIVFSSFKGITFFSILLFSLVGFSEEYIVIEQAIAQASIFVPFLAFGLTTSYSHYLINTDNTEIEYVYWRHISLVSFLCLLGAFVAFVSSNSWFVVIAMVQVILISRFFSQKYKVQNNVLIASFYDSVPYIILTVIVLLLSLEVVFEQALMILLLFSVFIYAFNISKELYKSKKDKFEPKRIFVFYKFGFSALLVSIVATSIVVSPRAFASSLVPQEELESYFLSLRYSAITVMVYQFVSIKWFSKIYKLALNKVLSVAVTLYLLAFIATNVGLFVIDKFDFLLGTENILFASNLTALWITSSFLEYFVNRERGVVLFCLLVTPLVFFVFFLLFYFKPTEYRFWFSISVTSLVLVQIVSIFKMKIINLSSLYFK